MTRDRGQASFMLRLTRLISRSTDQAIMHQASSHPSSIAPCQPSHPCHMPYVYAIWHAIRPAEHFHPNHTTPAIALFQSARWHLSQDIYSPQRADCARHNVLTAPDSNRPTCNSNNSQKLLGEDEPSRTVGVAPADADQVEGAVRRPGDGHVHCREHSVVRH